MQALKSLIYGTPFQNISYIINEQADNPEDLTCKFIVAIKQIETDRGRAEINLFNTVLSTVSTSSDIPTPDIVDQTGFLGSNILEKGWKPWVFIAFSPFTNMGLSLICHNIPLLPRSLYIAGLCASSGVMALGAVALIGAVSSIPAYEFYQRCKNIKNNIQEPINESNELKILENKLKSAFHDFNNLKSLTRNPNRDVLMLLGNELFSNAIKK